MGVPDVYGPGSPTSAPVSDRSIAHEVDLPVEGSNRHLVTESPPSPTRARRWLIPGFVLMIVVMTAVIVALAVVLSRNNGGSASPADVANRQATVDEWIVQQGYSSAESLADANSPPSRAAAFMAESTDLNVPTESSSTESVAWMERYALAVFFYALNGEGWLTDCNFLNVATSSCDWNVMVPLDNDYYALGASCTGTSGRIGALIFSK